MGFLRGKVCKLAQAIFHAATLERARQDHSTAKGDARVPENGRPASIQQFQKGQPQYSYRQACTKKGQEGSLICHFGTVDRQTITQR